MADYKVKNIDLAKDGVLLIEWASKHMPALSQIRRRFEKEKPLKGLMIGACLHVTKETAVLVEALKAGGAKVALCGSNPLYDGRSNLHENTVAAERAPYSELKIS